MSFNLIVVHCAATLGDVDAATIRDWHVNDRGWSDIGYHFVIRKSGDLESGRPIDRPGAHAKGFNDSYGICLAGGYGGAVDYTAAQWSTLEGLCKDIIQAEHITRIVGHNELSAKTCPNFDVRSWASTFFENE